MRGGSAVSLQEGQGLCPAEKAETAARCGFTVPVLEGARIAVDRELHALSSLVVTSARAQPAVTREIASLAAARALWSTRAGRSLALERKSPTRPGRTQPRGNALETFPLRLRCERVRSNLSDIPDNGKSRGLALPGQ